jgi:hypothetical protein
MLLAASACSVMGVQVSPSPSPMRDAAVGCWWLESSPGLLGRPLQSTLVRLDTVALPHGRLQMLLIPDHGLPRDWSYWGTTEKGNRVMLWFGNGFHGILVRAAVRGDQMRGYGRWADHQTWLRRGQVRGVRAPCPETAA